MTTRFRAVATLATAAVLTVLAGCGDDDAGTPTTTSTSSTSSTSGQATTTTTAPPTTTTTAPPEPEVRSVTVAVVGGEVAGGPTDLTVASGEQVHLEVTNDAVEEVHVHGFDLKAPVGPGQPAVFDFVADLPGIWEVELEGAGVLLLRLEVQG